MYCSSRIPNSKVKCFKSSYFLLSRAKSWIPGVKFNINREGTPPLPLPGAYPGVDAWSTRTTTLATKADDSQDVPGGAVSVFLLETEICWVLKGGVAHLEKESTARIPLAGVLPLLSL